MFSVDVMYLPSELTAKSVAGQVVVVFDVLRATTTMAAALAAGVKEIRFFTGIDEARAMAEQAGRQTVILCGESKCLKPEGFDLGNSPGGFDKKLHTGATVYMATTNGTRAILAASKAGAAAIIPAALVNSAAAGDLAAKLAHQLKDAQDQPAGITMLCAGTDGQVAMEDVLGAGSVVNHLHQAHHARLVSDRARLAMQFFAATEGMLAEMLADAQGGRNVIQSGLGEDVAFAARLDVIDRAGCVEMANLTLRAVFIPL